MLEQHFMSWRQVFFIVTGCALAGMVMGGLFGFGAGKVTPDFFREVIPWRTVEPLGIATFFGATAGVLLGGGLGCFAVIVQSILQWRRRDPKASRS